MHKQEKIDQQFLYLALLIAVRAQKGLEFGYVRVNAVPILAGEVLFDALDILPFVKAAQGLFVLFLRQVAVMLGLARPFVKMIAQRPPGLPVGFGYLFLLG